MTNYLDSINSTEPTDKISKPQQFMKNTKRLIGNTLIGLSSMGPVATTTTTAAPIANINTITAVAPVTSTAAKTISLWTAASLLAAHSGKDDPDIFTLKWENGDTAEFRADNITINPLEYVAMEINNINPEDLMPKIEWWDKNAYKHIEHLRIPESTVITDMMRKYGAGNHTPEEYQQLMMRLNTGMLWENPLWYNNYEAVWWTPWDEPSRHAHAEWFTLNTLVKHANFKVINPWYKNMYDVMYDLCKSDSSKINIMWISIDSDVNKKQYDSRNMEKLKQYDKEKNRLIFCAGWNIRTKNNNLLNKTYQENLPLPDEHSVYNSHSRAHDKNDNTLNRHLLITFWTDRDGDIDQTNEFVESSKFPVWFHDKVLFSGRVFPYRLYDWDKIYADYWKYPTSFVNYFNVAIADILFQMKADVPDIDEFLRMVRATSLTTDYIRFDLNWDGDTDDNYDGQPESQPLQLMNPAWFFKEYLMPTSLPTNLKSNETTPLDKWYYHGVVYQIPGAEVNINGQWIPFINDNKELIFSQNPMNLERRLNGETLNNYNYKPGDTINGQIIAVDDQWNGLNITKDFSVNIEDASGINTVTMNYTPDARYTIDGIRLNEKPTKPGIYITNGQKVIIK